LERDIEAFINAIDRRHFVACKAVSNAAIVARNLCPYSSFPPPSPKWNSAAEKPGKVSRFFGIVPNLRAHGLHQVSGLARTSIQSANGQNLWHSTLFSEQEGQTDRELFADLQRIDQDIRTCSKGRVLFLSIALLC
jgi:hypothetical protein